MKKTFEVTFYDAGNCDIASFEVKARGIGYAIMACAGMLTEKQEADISSVLVSKVEPS